MCEDSCSTVCPTVDEVWAYFTSSIPPVISMWQLEGTTVHHGVAGGDRGVINSFLAQMLEKMEQDEIPVSKVYKST